MNEETVVKVNAFARINEEKRGNLTISTDTKDRHRQVKLIHRQASSII